MTEYPAEVRARKARKTLLGGKDPHDRRAKPTRDRPEVRPIPPRLPGVPLGSVARRAGMDLRLLHPDLPRHPRDPRLSDRAGSLLEPGRRSRQGMPTGTGFPFAGTVVEGLGSFQGGDRSSRLMSVRRLAREYYAMTEDVDPPRARPFSLPSGSPTARASGEGVRGNAAQVPGVSPALVAAAAA